MKTRELIKERRDNVVLKLGISPKIVEMYNMFIDSGNSLFISGRSDNITIDISNNLEIKESTYTWDFMLYRDKEIVTLVTIYKSRQMTHVRLW